ncbi:MAG: HNH endonuclease [Candidatus Sungbacteria bacterium]|nr:HNH endonuclease [Candidatus Sungbacteria bacterium]
MQGQKLYPISSISTHEEVQELLKLGYKNASFWTVRYRRRKLGVKKYFSGEVRKHKAWIRTQAIKRYGSNCEICNYGVAIDTHHIIPKYKGGPHEIDNLMVICPNCHALITRRILSLNSRRDIKKTRPKVIRMLKKFYPNFG